MGQLGARLPTARRECQRAAPRRLAPPAGLLVCAALACGVVALPGREAPRIAFADAAAARRLGFIHQGSPTAEKYLLETMGSGVAVFDADNDGRLDVFFTNGAELSAPMPKGTGPAKDGVRFSNRLFHQAADGRFEDVTARAGLAGEGYGMGVAVGDYDNDGNDDLYVTAYGGNRLYRNQGDGTFADVTAAAGVAGSGWSTSAAFVDVDEDGRLDLFVARYLDWSFATNGYCGEPPPGPRAYCHPDRYPGATSLLFHNGGNGHFTEIGTRSGIADPGGKSLGVAIADFDKDGHIDIFVANDSVREFLFHNKGGGIFEDIALAGGAAFDQDGRPFAGMGVAFDDQNNDGWPDLLVTTLSNQLYAFFRNERGERFTYATHPSGLADISRLWSGWGLAMVDADNDGHRDLLVAQGHVLDTIEQTSPHLRYRQPLLFARGEGERFVDVSATAGEISGRPFAGRGLATGDLDGDGRVDAVVTTIDGPALLLLNTSERTGHWVGIRLRGIRSNRDGIGASVELTSASGAKQYATVSTTGSYLSAGDRTVHFGLGSETAAAITIRWPGGSVQVVDRVLVDRVTIITEAVSAPLR